MKKMILCVAGVSALVLGLSSYVQADEIAHIKRSVDTVWIMVAAFLVFFMQAGFAMLEAGFTRAKNASNVIMKGVMDFCLTSLVFWAVGYGLMFGSDNGSGLFGTSNFFLSLANPGDPDGLWQFAFWMFQVAFAGAAATIVAGAIAERAKFTSYLIYTVAVAALIYPLAGHWIWGGGWLAKLGMVDFAGSAVVHSVGGWAALAGAIIIGPRIGKYTSDGRPKAIPGHNIPLAALGVMILWFGWFGFNPGSTLSGVNGSIATIAVTTNLAACGGVAAMFTAWLRYGKPDTSMTLNGTLIGLVAITGGCAVVSPGAAIIIGAVAGVIVVLSVEFIDKVLKVDDPVGAVSVHGVGGALGILAIGLFADPAYSAASGVMGVGGTPVAGLFYGGGFSQLGVQLLGEAAVIGWAFGTALLLFYALKHTIGVRVENEGQLRGLDLAEHATESYGGFQIFITQ